MWLFTIRDLYNIVVEGIVEDEFFFGATNTNEAIAGLSESNARAIAGKDPVIETEDGSPGREYTSEILLLGKDIHDL